MIGLIFIAAGVVYIALSILIIVLTVRWAARTGRSPAKWGWIAAGVLYLLVFWDHLPTVVIREVACAVVPESVSLKSAQQWMSEHKDEPKPKPVSTIYVKDSTGHFVARISDRFGIRTEIFQYWPFPVRRYAESLVDLNTDEVLAKRLGVGAGYGSIGVGGSSQVFKIWLNYERCAKDSVIWHDSTRSFSDLTVH